ncbi:endonuclease domain-containing protein [Trebonia kvetii]|uniref:UDP-N-acetyl-alpha-D-muramoyl-L-alanyl-L-glutamate epimerase n=1 Tax=Trebonia kvetii TaxID=2480626 RepID=A0A6P2C6S2_9ACTN|nr:endonuclease domain-containing protein [Trebonia kvetii]TVZ06066.1 endonuclease domain-containing protein [Trebonia kvetii]
MTPPDVSPQPAPARGQVFRYEGFATDADRGLLTCRYSLDGREFTERVSLTPGPAWDSPAARAAARLVYVLAAVSYYKTAAPPVIDLGDTALTGRERTFLREFYLAGLGEYAYRNGLDLSDLRIEARQAPDVPQSQDKATQSGLRPLIPFGGGIDSIVTVEGIRKRTGDIVLFVVSRPGDRFAAIERPAAVSGLPVLRAGREIDPQLLRSAELGFRNGHVPVTGIISAIAVLAAVLAGRDTVVMSNEWSASVPTLEHDGRQINHQWSKSAAFEADFRDLLRAEGLPGYFSALRDRTELWVGERFAALTQYHATFRSCNRAFHLDISRRLGHWCGECDKCAFIDLILAPFMSQDQLAAVFAADGGASEPLGNPALRPKFEALLGAGTKPFECVGEITECRAAVVLAARRADRAATPLLQELAAEITGRPDAPTEAEIAAMRRPVGASFIPAEYSLEDA